MELAETLIVAVPTAADSWTNIGTFTVPSGVKRLKRIDCAVAPDWSVTAGSVRNAPAFRLQGSGLLEQSPHEYLGQFAASSTVTTGGAAQSNLSISYDVDIPVQPGGTYQADINSLDEVVTAGTAMINAIYDDQAPTQNNSMSQILDVAGTTSADAYATLGTFTLPKLDTAKDAKKIKAISIGVAVDQGTSAISLRSAPIVRMSGAGIKGSGRHDYIGPVSFTGHIGTSASQGAYPDNGTKHIKGVDIDINPGGQILVEHRFEVETPTASTVAIGIILE